MRTLEAPTYKTYEDNAEQWQEWKRQANTLPIAELERHAGVSKNNRHACHDCFTCACVELLTEKRMLTKPIRALECCVCGSGTRGRQWWNRDTGYGVCPSCVAYVRSKGETEAEIKDLYGVEGIHWGVEA